jgi:hypothetical protein
LSCEGSSSGKLVEMHPFGQGLVVLLVKVLTKICMPSLRCSSGWRVLSFWMLYQQGYDHPQAARQLTEVFTLWMMVLLSSSGIILPSKGAPNPGPRQ